MDARERSELIVRYSKGFDEIVSALADASDADLDVRERPDEWSPRDVVHHLADAELRSTVRLRQLLAEENPVIQGYDEAGYARRLPSGRAIHVSLAAISAARESNLELLRLLSDADFARTGTHTESGPYGVADWLRIYTAHAFDHADQIRRARAAAD